MLAANPSLTLADGTKLNIDTVRSWAKENRRITVIKALRELSGVGLKDAKDAVDAASDKIGDGRYNCRPDNVVELFRPYFPETNDSIAINMAKGIDIAIKNYDVLGYDDMFEAARTVLEKYESKVK